MWGAPFRRTPGTAAVVKRVVFSVVPLVIACHGSTEGSMGRSWFRLRANQATLARIVDEFVYSDVSGGGWRVGAAFFQLLRSEALTFCCSSDA